MGYYLSVPIIRGKDRYLQNQYKAIVLPIPPEKLEDLPKGQSLVCVVDNIRFDGAAYCYDKEELEVFATDISGRKKVWILMDTGTVLELCSLRDVPVR